MLAATVNAMPKYHVLAQVDILYMIEADDPHAAAGAVFDLPEGSGVELGGRVIKVTEPLPVVGASVSFVPDLRDDDRAVFDASSDESGFIGINDATGEPLGSIDLPMGGYPAWGKGKLARELRITAEALAFAVLQRLPTDGEIARLIVVLRGLPNEWTMTRAELRDKIVEPSG